jgi:hypothetical protein
MSNLDQTITKDPMLLIVYQELTKALVILDDEATSLYVKSILFHLAGYLVRQDCTAIRDISDYVSQLYKNKKSLADWPKEV